jgi:uncharacterized protein (DUF342 family)
MSRVLVRVAADGSSAAIEADAGPPAGADAAASALAAAGVCAGIDPDALARCGELLARGARIAAVIVARGTPPTAGADGRLELTFARGPLPGTAHADGHVDYRERHLLHPVRAGDPIADVLPPAPGRPGGTVTGTAIPPAPGKPCEVRHGPGVRRDGDRLLAARDGAVTQTGGTLDVVAWVEHRGDVDYRSGNLHSGGSLTVRGDVHEGFEVHAHADVHVEGAVLGGSVQAGGSIEVRQGVLGVRAELRAGGHLHCRHATAARLHAGGCLEVHDQAANCQLRAGDVHLARGRGVLLGGRALAETAIEVRHAGNAEGAATVLGIVLPGEQTAELARRTATATRLGRDVVRARGGAGRDDGKALRRAAQGDAAALAERLRVRRLLHERLAQATIRVTGTAHAGVVVQFGTLRLPLDVDHHAVTFRFDPRDERIVTEDCR